jgi:hypothetical protein
MCLLSCCLAIFEQPPTCENTICCWKIRWSRGRRPWSYKLFGIKGVITVLGNCGARQTQFSFLLTCITLAKRRTGWLSDNAIDSYSEDTSFESLPGPRLFWLTSFVVFPQPIWASVRQVPSPSTFIIHDPDIGPCVFYLPTALQNNPQEQRQRNPRSMVPGINMAGSVGCRACGRGEGSGGRNRWAEDVPGKQTAATSTTAKLSALVHSDKDKPAGRTLVVRTLVERKYRTTWLSECLCVELATASGCYDQHTWRNHTTDAGKEGRRQASALIRFLKRKKSRLKEKRRNKY